MLLELFEWLQQAGDKGAVGGTVCLIVIKALEGKKAAVGKGGMLSQGQTTV